MDKTEIRNVMSIGTTFAVPCSIINVICRFHYFLLTIISLVVLYSVFIKDGINSIKIQEIIFQKNARSRILRKKLDIQGVPKLRYDLPVDIFK